MTTTTITTAYSSPSSQKSSPTPVYRLQMPKTSKSPEYKNDLLAYLQNVLDVFENNTDLLSLKLKMWTIDIFKIEDLDDESFYAELQKRIIYLAEKILVKPLDKAPLEINEEKDEEPILVENGPFDFDLWQKGMWKNVIHLEPKLKTAACTHRFAVELIRLMKSFSIQKKEEEIDFSLPISKPLKTLLAGASTYLNLDLFTDPVLVDNPAARAIMLGIYSNQAALIHEEQKQEDLDFCMKKGRQSLQKLHEVQKRTFELCNEIEKKAAQEIYQEIRQNYKSASQADGQKISLLKSEIEHQTAQISQLEEKYKEMEQKMDKLEGDCGQLNHQLLDLKYKTKKLSRKVKKSKWWK